MSTSQRYSGGRFVLGLGSSHRAQVLDEHAIAYAEPLERVRETLEVVRLLLRDGALANAGKLISIKNFDLWFTPLRKDIPIYLAAVFPKMLELCGRTAQGVLLTWRTVESIQPAVQQIGAGAPCPTRSWPASAWRASRPTAWSGSGSTARPGSHCRLCFPASILETQRRAWCTRSRPAPRSRAEAQRIYQIMRAFVAGRDSTPGAFRDGIVGVCRVPRSCSRNTGRAAVGTFRSGSHEATQSQSTTLEAADIGHQHCAILGCSLPNSKCRHPILCGL
jgi:hypothetical protein